MQLYQLRFFKFSDAHFSYGPSNKAVVGNIGICSRDVFSHREVIMNCGSTGNFKQWKYKKLGAENETVLSNNLNISRPDLMSLNSLMPGQYDLHLSYVSIFNAGTYSCISVTIDKSFRFEAYLAVLGEYILRISRLIAEIGFALYKETVFKWRIVHHTIYEGSVVYLCDEYKFM